MHYVQAFDRDQFMMATWDSMVDPESAARELIEKKERWALVTFC